MQKFETQQSEINNSDEVVRASTDPVIIDQATARGTSLKRSKWYVVGLFAAALVIILVGYLSVGRNEMDYSSRNVNEKNESQLTTNVLPTTSSEKSEITPVQNQRKSNVTLGTGFLFYLPPDWNSKISDQSGQHFFGRFTIPGLSEDSTFVEIESIAASRFVKSPYTNLIKSNNQTINGVQAVISEGSENYKSSKRLVNQATFTNNGNVLVITYFRSDFNSPTTLFEELINSVHTQSEASSVFNFIKSVYAAESVAGMDVNQFEKIEVMGDPLPERITKDDLPYKDGYVDLYSFDAFKGQRLTAVAMEDSSTNPGSFIESELYNQNGYLIDSRDTRIEFIAPYTGRYYYLVRSFNLQEGGYLLKIFDRNQTTNLVYVKYDDGSEKLVDPNTSPPVYGEKEVAVIIQFVNPIEVIDNQTVRYYAKPQEFEPGLGLITTPINVFVKQETYADFVNTPGNALPEENNEYKVAAVITKLSPSKILLEREGEVAFPKNNHIVLTGKKVGWGRFFTEDPVQ